MSLEVIKKGQGSVARLAAYAACSILVLFGVVRFYATINRPGGVILENVPVVGDLTVYKVVSIVLGATALLALHWFLNRPRSVDLLIDTEQEMRKVTWPTLPEVWNATVVVAMVTVVLAFTMYGLDEVLRSLLFLVFGRPQVGGTA
jgi:preprotein translocase SecE subunit